MLGCKKMTGQNRQPLRPHAPHGAVVGLTCLDRQLLMYDKRPVAHFLQTNTFISYVFMLTVVRRQRGGMDL